MKIAMIGYGKMGHMIKEIAQKMGHEVVSIDAFDKTADYLAETPESVAKAVKECKADVAIEFTHPKSVLGNMKAIIPTKIPLVVGTTGWYDKMDEVEKLVKDSDGSLFWAGNFSIGVNMFYRIVENAARLMAQYDEYDTAIWEAHHNQKADSPSGTAIEIAKRVMAQMPSKTEIVDDAFRSRPEKNQLHVSSTRIGSVPGTHKVFFDSPADTIELTHTVRNREGLALGAVRAAEWLKTNIDNGKLGKGKVFTMDDFL
ncbi:MAG: 4-hydroxy-tetrahydrodipicolinate reductase, partial [Treponemataceae bacterium]|nr:4-hydroxy-tetrahydrodipicolinate reductase [Treponemataceae bacterium]